MWECDIFQIWGLRDRELHFAWVRFNIDKIETAKIETLGFCEEIFASNYDERSNKSLALQRGGKNICTN